MTADPCLRLELGSFTIARVLGYRESRLMLVCPFLAQLQSRDKKRVLQAAFGFSSQAALHVRFRWALDPRLSTKSSPAPLATRHPIPDQNHIPRRSARYHTYHPSPQPDRDLWEMAL